MYVAKFFLGAIVVCNFTSEKMIGKFNCKIQEWNAILLLVFKIIFLKYCPIFGFEGEFFF